MGGGKMKGEGVVLGLIAIRCPVSSRRSHGVFVVWTRCCALSLCPRCRRHVYIVCRGHVVLWPWWLWWLWCGVAVVWWYGFGVHEVNDNDER